MSVRPQINHLNFARMTLPLAVVLFVCGVLGESATDGASLMALVPAGALIVTRGVLMLTRRRAVLEPLAKREQSRFWGRMGFRTEHPFGAAMLVVIGTGWAVMGLLHGLG